jgi:hypothetical protein
MSKINYVLTGEALDQETIVKQRSWYEDHVREHITDFKETKLRWNMRKNGNFSFKLEFYG